MTDELTPEEMQEYLVAYYGRLLENRYRYYMLDAPVLEDAIYDYIERDYNALAEKHGAKVMKMVDFDFEDPLAIEAGKRVDAGTDSHSLWIKEMQPIWDRIGKPSKEQKTTASKSRTQV